MKTIRRGVALAIGLLLAASPVSGESRQETGPLLDVPYIAQPVALCGGAALAMVLRYLGERDVFAQDFAPLVDAREQGIRTSTLAQAAIDRGWTTVVASTATDVPLGGITAQAERRRPVIALIEDRPGRFHYVVVIGVTDAGVVVHDPARAPFRTFSREDFAARSAAAGNWMLVVAPGEHEPPTKAPSPRLDVATVSVSPCRDQIDRAVSSSRAGDLAAADADLTAARARCLSDPAPVVELAGLRFIQSRWADAENLAKEALALAPADRQALELLASSRYMQRDLTGALAAWNQIGEPRADLVDVAGLARTRVPVVVSAIDIEPRSLLTPGSFARAGRRLNALPAASATSLRYDLQDNGTARLTAAAVERELLPQGWPAFAALGLQAAIAREARVDIASPTGSGEVWTVSYRWPAKRPRIGGQLAMPAPVGHGVVRLEAFWDKQTYRSAGTDSVTFVPTRRRVAVEWSDWLTGHLRWQTNGAIDRFGSVETGSVGGGLEYRLLGDRLAVGGAASAWMPVDSTRRFASGTVSGAWRSRIDTTRPVLSITSGASVATAAAPLALWSGAGARGEREVLLRGHLLLDDGEIAGEVFGRRIAFMTAEYEHPVRSSPFGQIGIALFADTARAWQRLDAAGASRLHVDVGAGLRLHAPGLGGHARLDVGYATRDGNVVVSAGWLVSLAR